MAGARVALLGWPLGHSISPAFQNAGFAALGLEIAYEASGPPDGIPVILLHGFPYDPRSYDDVVPPIVAAATYLAVYFQVKELSRRVRIALVSVSTGTWFIAVLLRAGPEGFLPATTPLLALGSGLAITWAYQPPRWVKRRLEAHDAVALHAEAAVELQRAH